MLAANTQKALFSAISQRKVVANVGRKANIFHVLPAIQAERVLCDANKRAADLAPGALT